MDNKGHSLASLGTAAKTIEAWGAKGKRRSDEEAQDKWAMIVEGIWPVPEKLVKQAQAWQFVKLDDGKSRERRSFS